MCPSLPVTRGHLYFFFLYAGSVGDLVSGWPQRGRGALSLAHVLQVCSVSPWPGYRVMEVRNENASRVARRGRWVPIPGPPLRM